MKTYLLISCISIYNVACQPNTNDLPPVDEASKIAGSYQLTSSYFSLSNQANPYQSGSLVIDKATPSSVKGAVEITDAGVVNASYSGHWELVQLKGDTLSLRGGACGCLYYDKQIHMLLDDGTLSLHFKKVDE